ncbi:nitrate reductase molybdenum cofactor assembly chaperone [Persephonella sp.]|uniref:nitrate reductase molybdenum cofactor assembly chaperone n=1 Tax=Persephonella sp. TaxID=2060922 RepID=UPI002622045A|nr:nitrate reductase molybdenum cofactor assembly chaperone [Persephonella sp.]
MDFKEKIGTISLLLRYPEKDIKKIVEEIDLLELEDENIAKVINFYKTNDLFTIQQEYVKSFDLNEKASLYLTYHKFRDDPKRGNYLARLISYYREKGFEFIDNELPDFLPVVLEFISYIDENTGLKVLKAFSKELKQIYKGLLDIDSKFTPLIEFLLKITENMEVNQND